ncbi:TlpA family protein disulfide reductase [Mariniflexile rhizosphaerae]|uniref:TlpA family protein disulfide reductase n=1 Tax=unclassified Mariniflexile TaxID=2643887 RepID=UPI000E3D4A16|nr:TlpA disulfide reductase family protein [Mariniflexile sp. TRM1-10]
MKTNKKYFVQKLNPIILLGIITLLQLTACKKADSDTPLNRNIVIYGTLGVEIKASDREKIEEEVVVQSQFLSGSDLNHIQRCKVELKSNNFSITIKPQGDFSFVSLASFPSKILKKGSFFIVPGDSIHIDIQDSEKCIINSNNPQLLQCQLDLMEVKNISEYPITENSSAVSRLSDYKDSAFNRYEEIFSQYEGKVAPEVLNTLKIHYQTQQNAIFMTKVNSYALFSHNDSLKYKAKSRIISDFETLDIISDTLQVRYSINYAEYLLSYIRNYHQLTSPLANQEQLFAKIYKNIDKNYQGLLRDKLLTVLSIRYMNSSKASYTYLSRSHASVKDPDYREILRVIREARTAGKKVFPFALPDVNGKVYTPDDFKGKVVVCKLWFTGCGGCTYLHKVLKPWKLKYKDNKEVEFISINVNNKKGQWEKGLQSGVYCSPDEINLSTFGEGFDHPMLKYYNFVGYPQVLVFDKNGNLISANPAVGGNYEVLKSELDKMILENL